MIPITTCNGKRIAVFGLGLSGLWTARALAAGGAEIAAWDDSRDARGKAEAEGISLGNLEAADWSGFDALVLTPGVPLTHPEPHWTVLRAREAGIEIIGDTELFFRERAGVCADSPVIAITGTNGKSTTTALTAHLINAAGGKAVIGGNIGEAVLSLSPPAPDCITVLELSSYQLDLTPGVAPNAAALLNITPDHLDRHGDMDRYGAIKASIFRNLGPEDRAVISQDDVHCRAVAASFAGACGLVPVSASRRLGNGVFVEDGVLFESREGEARPVAELASIDSLRGRHNWQNAAVAWALVRHFGLPPRRLGRALKSFPGLVHRMETLGRRGPVLFVNDSKATNANAAACSLAAFDDIYWIAGGLAKEGGITSLRGLFPRVARAYLIGEAAADFAATLCEAGVDRRMAGTLERAVAMAAEDAGREGRAAPVVLLAPASASFDQFESFTARGEAFRTLVAALDGMVLGGAPEGVLATATAGAATAGAAEADS